jgi:16S rRNA G966 N2-methylase RsmD
MVGELTVKIDQNNIRESLSMIRNEIKDDMEIRNDKLYMQLVELLSHEDPKVRKNTAIILGSFKKSGVKNLLLDGYRKETIDFVKVGYLKGLSKQDCKSIVDELKQIQSELLADQESDKKHVQSQLKVLNPLIQSYGTHKRKMVKLLHKDVDVILTTLPYYQFTLFDYVLDHKYKPVGQGVLVRTKSVYDLLPLRNYKDMIIPIKNCSLMEKDGDVIVERIRNSNLMELLENLFDNADSFYYKLTDTFREKDSKLMNTVVKGLLELYPDRLLNATKNYEIEIVLKELMPKKISAYLKLTLLDNPRFDYRKEVISNSMQPYVAATLLEVAKPYMEDYARVLDPFCGSGVTLIERCLIKPVKFSLGLDIFTKGLEAAKRNAKAADIDMHFVHKDSLRFVNTELFDEIITDMPTYAQMRDKAALTELYDKFFARIRKLVKPGGYVFIYTSEIALVEKNLRLQKNYLSLIEHNDVPRGKNLHYFFIIQVR